MNKDYRTRKVIKKVLEKENSKRKYVLNPEKWGEFRVGDLFIKHKVNKYASVPENEGEYDFVSSTSINNGIAKKVDETPIEGNCITVSTNGDCFDCFYHASPIVVSTDVEVLYGNFLNLYTALFLCSVLSKEKNKWSYGRKPKNDKVYSTVIKLPATKEGKPNWEWMEGYIKSLNCEPLTTTKKKKDTLKLDPEKWGEFRVGDLFEVVNGKKYPADIREPGDLPLVSTSAINNGISDYILERTDSVYSNLLTVAYSGSVGATFYHKDKVFVGETVFALLPKFKCNVYIGHFISTIMNLENFRYDYGRKIIGTKYIDFKIKLPITEEGTPDWKWMEDYIKSLPYGDRL